MTSKFCESRSFQENRKILLNTKFPVLQYYVKVKIIAGMTQ